MILPFGKLSASHGSIKLPYMPTDPVTSQIPPREPLLIVISGPSGVGKDSVIHQLRNRNLDLHFVVTANTRPPRAGEKEGVDYFFVSRSRFEEMIANGDLLEHSLVYKDYKGIPREQVRQGLATGKDVILRLDVQGAAKVKGLCPEVISIFLAPKNGEELVQRLHNRNTETVESLQIRLDYFRQEMEQVKQFDYFVENSQGHLEDAVDNIVEIIHAEHMRVNPRKVSL
jgi:guanylate kinase